jgi:2-hydroxy-3-keto-5-methylthiopentenyl-1-phosphate phosphatase
VDQVSAAGHDHVMADWQRSGQRHRRIGGCPRVLVTGHDEHRAAHVARSLEDVELPAEGEVGLKGFGPDNLHSPTHGLAKVAVGVSHTRGDDPGDRSVMIETCHIGNGQLRRGAQCDDPVDELGMGAGDAEREQCAQTVPDDRSMSGKLCHGKRDPLDELAAVADRGAVGVSGQSEDRSAIKAFGERAPAGGSRDGAMNEDRPRGGHDRAHFRRWWGQEAFAGSRTIVLSCTFGMLDRGQPAGLWYHPAPVRRFLIAVDFDGTITQHDTLHLIVDRFGDRSVWDRITPDVVAGRVSVEEAMQAEFAMVRATPDQIRELVRAEAGIREGFVEFVDWARAAGHEVGVLSDGFRVVIADILDRIGLGDLPCHSHDAVFSAEGTQLVWTNRGERCKLCNRPCKRFALAAIRSTGLPVAYVGDGVSDRCVCGAADVVFARSELADWLSDAQRPFVAFEDFHEIRAHLEHPTEVTPDE